jgi:hypothetical protein
LSAGSMKKSTTGDATSLLARSTSTNRICMTSDKIGNIRMPVVSSPNSDFHDHTSNSSQALLATCMCMTSYHASIKCLPFLFWCSATTQRTNSGCFWSLNLNETMSHSIHLSFPPWFEPTTHNSIHFVDFTLRKGWLITECSLTNLSNNLLINSQQQPWMVNDLSMLLH